MARRRGLPVADRQPRATLTAWTPTGLLTTTSPQLPDPYQLADDLTVPIFEVVAAAHAAAAAGITFPRGSTDLDHRSQPSPCWAGCSWPSPGS